MYPLLLTTTAEASVFQVNCEEMQDKDVYSKYMSNGQNEQEYLIRSEEKPNHHVKIVNFSFLVDTVEFCNDQLFCVCVNFDIHSHL